MKHCRRHSRRIFNKLKPRHTDGHRALPTVSRRSAIDQTRESAIYGFKDDVLDSDGHQFLSDKSYSASSDSHSSSDNNDSDHTNLSYHSDLESGSIPWNSSDSESSFTDRRWNAESSSTEWIDSDHES